MRNDLRDIYFYDLNVRSSTKYAHPCPLEDAITTLEAISKTDSRIYPIANGTESLELREVSIDTTNNIATLLIARTDPSSPNAVYSNPAGGSTRIIEKAEGEAGEYGAHVLLSLDPLPNKPNQYLAVIERVTGVGRVYIQRLLNALLQGQYKTDPTTFQSEDLAGRKVRSGAPKMVSFRPLFELVGHPSDEFINDIDAGRFTGMTLVQSSTETQVGGRSYLKPEEKTLRVKVSNNSTVQNLWDDLKSALASESSNWSKAGIKFKSSDGRASTVTLDLATGNVLDENFVKKTRLSGITPFLDFSAQSIVAHFETKMKEEFIAYRGEMA